MNLADAILGRGRVVVVTVLCLAGAGLASWWTMPRQEDPDMVPRWGQLLIVAPGFSPQMLEEQVARPIERELAQVKAVRNVELTLRTDVLFGLVELDAETPSFPDAWTHVREALAVAAEDLPDGVEAPSLDDQTSGTRIAIFALTGAPPDVLRDKARVLQRRLQRIPDTLRVTVELDPTEEIVVHLHPDVARAHAIPPGMLATQLTEAGRVRATGSLVSGQRDLRLELETELHAVEAIGQLPIALPTGEVVALEGVTTTTRQRAEPVRDIGRWNGEPAVFVAVTARPDVHAVRLGNEIAATVEALAPQLFPADVHTMLLQSTWVEHRLGELTRSLAHGIGILALLLLFALGLRAGALVAVSIPIVVLVALGFYAASGGTLHQISIAAFVLALGLVVDNAIVLVEATARRIDEGLAAPDAARQATRELAMPLFAATGTTVAAFVPMLLASGDTAAFTGAIPIVVILSLITSWILAVTFVPVVAGALLRRAPNAQPRPRRGAALPRVAGTLAVRAPWVVLGVALALVGLTALQADKIGQQFFPASDRTTVVVDIELPEGTPATHTDEVISSLMHRLLAREDVVQVAASSGRGLPRFFYNVIGVSSMPNAGQLAVEVQRPDQRAALRADVRAWAQEHPAVLVIDRILAQGPPTGAPVEVRLLGDDFDALLASADRTRALLASLPAARQPRHDAGPGSPVVRAIPLDDALAHHGLQRADIAHALRYASHGLPAGHLQEADLRVPVVVRAPNAPLLDPAELAHVPLFLHNGTSVPLIEVARLEPSMEEAVIHRRAQARVVTVRAELNEGATFSDLVNILRQELPERMDPGVTWELGGEAEGAEEASTALMRTLPFGVALLLFFLLVEFNSLRRLAIIFVTVPLAATGVIPGLLLLNQPFGFMSLLGVLAVIGIVVNNAIVLISVTDDERRRGLSVDEAVRAGLDRRWRAVLLTTGTTILGLLPLALTPSPLWPPLATAMISGIGASALLTLLVVPALYRILAGGPLPGNGTAPPVALSTQPATHALALVLLVTGCAALLTPTPAQANEREGLTLQDAMRAADTTPMAYADEAQVRAADAELRAMTRAGRLPTFGARAEGVQRSAAVAVETPAGPLEMQPDRALQAGAELAVPLIRLADQFDRPRAAEERIEAQRRSALRASDDRRLQAGEAWLNAWSIPQERAILQAQEARLEAARQQALRLHEAGVGLRSDVDRLDLALTDVRIGLARLDRAEGLAEEILGRRAGQNGPVAAVGDLPSPDVLAALAASREREDIAALVAQQESAALEARALRRDALPELRAEARWRWSSQEGLESPHQLEAALILEWSLWAGGARRAAAEAHLAQADALGHAATETRRMADVQIWDARSRLALTFEEETQRELAVAAARRQLAAVEARRAAGTALVVELLDAEEELRSAELQLVLVQVERVRATLLIAWAGG